MKKFLCSLLFALILLSCNNEADKTSTSSTDSSATTTGTLPYTASYSSSWTTDVSDSDLKMVLTSYKDWADGNMTGLANAFGDTLEFDAWNGDHMKLGKADLVKMWTGFRDSLSSVTIDMEAWDKKYSTDKKESHVVVWYKEIDTYKDGRVDSSRWHDINRVKDGKIVWYSQFKRQLK